MGQSRHNIPDSNYRLTEIKTLWNYNNIISAIFTINYLIVKTIVIQLFMLRKKVLEGKLGLWEPLFSLGY